MSNENVFRAIAVHVVRLVEPFRLALASEENFKAFLYKIGWSATSFPQEYQDLALAIDQVLEDVQALSDGATPEEVVEVVKDFIPIYNAVRNPPAVPAGLDTTVFLQEAGQHIFALTVTEYLQKTLPGLSQALQATGVITFEERPNPTGRTPFNEPKLNFSRVGDLFSKPGSFLELVFAWGANELDIDQLLSDVMDFFNSLLIASSAEEIDDATAKGYQPDRTLVARRMEHRTRIRLAEGVVGTTPVEVGIDVIDLPADTTHLPGIIIQPFIPPEIGQSFPLSDNLSLNVRAGTDVANTFGILIRPSTNPIEVRYPFQPGTQPPSAGFGLSLVFAPPEPTILIGRAGSTRLEVKGFEAGVQLDFEGTNVDVGASIVPKNLLLAIKADDGDGFIGKILGSVDVQTSLDASVGWSKKRGLRIGTGGGFEITLSPNKTLGPITLRQLKVSLKGASDDGASAVVTRIGLGIDAKLGPVAVALDDIGAQLAMRLVEGNLGPVDLDVGFVAPRGIGIAVNGGPVSGGGFLSFEDGRYSGALALSVYAISVKAFGIIDTKFPDGHRGFSFIIIISAEFTPIQLGFGFTLNGVGGILGINRDLNEEALRNAVMRGSMGNVLFPKDPIKDAPSILHDIAELFPPADGHFAFGPMAILAWGTPAIIEARLGIVIVFPGPRIALLGTVQVLLPPGTGAAAPEKRLVEIHLDIAGLLDFPKKHFALDAKLHNSNVVGFPISGEMAARIDWGQNQNLLIAMGGFHPHFKPPAGFPKLRRMAIDLGISGNPSATLSGYMALTSNTAQVGAALDVRATGGGASLRGGLAFDALIVFSPFSFEASLEGGVHVDFHGAGFGMHFHGHISGPAPWHLKGDVCVSILWWDACVGFSVTLGGEHKPELPAIDVWAGSVPDAAGIQEVPGLERAIAAPGNWAGVLPPNGYQAVSIRQTDSSGASRVDPLGVATFQQKVLPFKLAISKFAGRDRPKNDPVTVTVKKVLVDGDDLVAANRVKDVTDAFAPAQYQKLPDAQALSSPSFQPMQAGFSVSSADLTNGTQKTKPIAFQTFVVGNPNPAAEFPVNDNMLLAMVDRSATAQGGLRTGNIDRFVDFAKPVPVLAEEAYALASKTTLKRFTTAADDAAYALTADKLAALPQDVRATLQIVPIHELAAAA